MAHALNDRLGNVGKTVNYTPPIDARPGERTESLRDLVRDMERGRVELLVILGGNPVYTAPADFQFAKHLEKVPLRIRHGLYVDETSYQCHWHLPEAHYLEAWSDARAYDGTASIVQPLVEPLYQGRSAHEVVAMLSDLRDTSGREIVRSHWQRQWAERGASGPFEPRWQRALHDGVIADTALEAQVGQAQRRLAEAVAGHGSILPSPFGRGAGGEGGGRCGGWPWDRPSP